MIDQFSKETFEEYLEQHKPYEALGIIQGEYAYKIVLDGQASIMLRSSIKANGQAASTGKDSIRLWLVGSDDKPIGSKITNWTTRVNGWQSRLNDKVLELVKRRVAAGDCPQCQKPFGIYKRKSDKKLFAKCFPCSKRTGRNVNGNLATEGIFSVVSRNEAQPAVKAPETRQTAKLDGFLANPFDEDEPVAAVGDFAPSKYQKVIFDFVKNGNGHGVVVGVAGCGKTKTNVESLKLLSSNLRVKYAAFNKHVERDTSAKSPCWVDVSTFHSWGLGDIKVVFPKIKINQWKIYNLIDDKAKNVTRENKASFAKVIGLLKGQLLEPTQENILDISIAFNIDIEQKNCSFIRQIFLDSIKDFDEIDFDDMVYYPASGIVGCQKFDFIFVDEAQDMNLGQYILAKRSLAENGRMLLIGDPHQSIYAFRGAHIGIMAEMAEEMNATVMPLPVSYRAPQAIVNHVNREYSHIRFEAADGAKKGHIEQISYDAFLGNVQEADAVLCRTNAPLVGPCFELIRQGVKASILGRDIGQGLVKLIEKRQVLKRVNDLDSLLEQIDVYCNNEARKAVKARQEARAQLMIDQMETIYALSAGCQTIQQLKEKTKTVFSDKAKGVTFSTVHKAKGLEWETVYVIGPKGNHKMGDPEQETNIRYVRDTRTLDKLYFVDDE